LAQYDWERILAEAASVLSPTQLQGLRAQAASARNDVRITTANKGYAAAPKQ
jgi:hypothetical protein